MKAKRKRHSAAFKAKVGFEALVGLKTVSQLAREYGVHPTQVTQWRATIRDHMPELFEPGKPGTEDQEELIAQLHQKIPVFRGYGCLRRGARVPCRKASNRCRRTSLSNFFAT